MRKLFSVFLALTALVTLSDFPAQASALHAAEKDSASEAISANFGSSSWVAPGADSDSTQFFKSGVTFDPTNHRWVDRYNGKPMDLGLPGVNERFGKNSVISAVSGSSTTTTTTTTKTAGTFPWKKVIIGTAIGAAIATSIAVPIACGVHHHHHVNNNVQKNQLATFYYLRNQTLPYPTVPMAVPVFVPPGGGKPPPPPPRALLSLFR